MTPSHPLLLLLVLLLDPPRLRLHLQPLPADTAALEFHGFRAGARLDELQTHWCGARRRAPALRSRQGRPPGERVSRGLSPTPELGERGQPLGLRHRQRGRRHHPVEPVSADQLDRWRQTIERRYGRVDATVQGSQWMMQWVRQGRMLRLTWRIERGEKVASVSLVDGRVLDAWGGAEPQRPAGQPRSRTRKLPSDSSSM